MPRQPSESGMTRLSMLWVRGAMIRGVCSGMFRERRVLVGAFGRRSVLRR